MESEFTLPLKIEDIQVNPSNVEGWLRIVGKLRIETGESTTMSADIVFPAKQFREPGGPEEAMRRLGTVLGWELLALAARGLRVQRRALLKGEADGV